MHNKGDLVWAKVRYCPHWPAIVVDAPTDFNVPKNNTFVRFFGSNHYAVIDNKNIHDFHTYRTKYERKKKTSDMKNALQCIDEYSADRTAFIPDVGDEPAEGAITLIQELGDTIKQERDMDKDPYDTIQMNVNNYDPRDREISTLKAEKAQLVVDLLNLKSQHNDLFLKGQEFQRKQNLLTNEIRTLREQNKLYEEQALDQRQIIDGLKSANDTLSSLVMDLRTQFSNSNDKQTPLPSPIVESSESDAEKEVSEGKANVSKTNKLQVKLNNPNDKQTPLPSSIVESSESDAEKELPEVKANVSKTNKLQVKTGKNAVKGTINQEVKIRTAAEEPETKRKSNDKAPNEPKEKKPKNEVKLDIEPIRQSESEALKLKGMKVPVVIEPRAKRHAGGKAPREPKPKKGKDEVKANIGPIDKTDLGAQELKDENESALGKLKAKRSAKGKASKKPQEKDKTTAAELIFQSFEKKPAVRNPQKKRSRTNE